MAPSYLEWNELIFKKIFNEENAGRPVSIFVDGQLLNDWAEELGAGKQSGDQGSVMFANACKAFLSGRPDTVAKRISSMAKSWKVSGFQMAQPPNMIGLLALLVLASSWGGAKYQANKYYGRYWDMMGDLGKDSTIPDIPEVINAWNTLQEWTQANEGNLGIFKVRTLAPAFKNFGIIIAQSLLRPTDEMKLRTMFYKEGAEREFDYPDATFLAWFEKHKKSDDFSPRAQAAFDSEGNRDLFLERLRQEFEMWDGEPADAGDLGGRMRNLSRHAFLCLVDNPEPSFTVRVDLSSRAGEPDVLELPFGKDKPAMNLKAPSNGSALSLPLRQIFINDGLSAQRADEVYLLRSAPALSHFLASKLTTSRQGAGDTYEPMRGEIRLLAKIPAVSLTDYVEVTNLRRNIKHVLLVSCNHPDLGRIEAWARRFPGAPSEADRYRPAFLAQTKWKFISLSDNVREIDGAGLDQLKFERKRIAKLEGGLRFFGSGNKYLNSLPPRLVFDTIHPVRLTVGSTTIDIADPSVAFELGTKLALGANQLSVIELTPAGLVPETAELSLSLHEHSEWTPEGEGRWLSDAAEIGKTSQSEVLIGCRTGQLLPFQKSSGINFTWSIHSQPNGGNYAIPCSNLLACDVGIRELIKYKFQVNGRPVNRTEELLWMKTFRESKLHPVIFKSPDARKSWEDMQKALNNIKFNS